MDAQRLLPNLTTRSEQTLGRLQGETRSTGGIAVTGVLTLQLAIDHEDGIHEVDVAELAAAEMSEAEAFELARRNLLARSKDPWIRVADGLFQSPWADGFDAARLALPTLFPRIGMRGDPIVTVPTRNAILVTGTEEPAGLRALYPATRALAEQERGLHLAALRLDNGTWRPLDARDVAVTRAVPALAHLEYLQDALDHAVVGAHVRAALASQGYEVESLQSGDLDGVVITFTVMPRVAGVVVPQASLVACNGDFLLWYKLADLLGKNLVQLDVWPPHYQVVRVPTLMEIQAAKLAR